MTTIPQRRPVRVQFSRRQLLWGLCAGAAGAFALWRFGLRRPRGVPRALSPSAFAFVEAVSARLIPTTSLGGAREAGVCWFIDRQLANPSFAVFRKQIEAGAASHAQFAELEASAQDRALTLLQRENPHLFQVLLTLTLEGLFSDPRHGGNRDRVGWRLLGLHEHA